MSPASTADRIRVLIVEDTAIDAELASRALRKAGIEHVAERVDNEPDFMRALSAFDPDIILSDHSMPRFDGLAVLELVKRHAPHIPFIFVSGTIGEEVAIDSLKRGAADYIIKNNMGRLAAAVSRAMKDSADRALQQRIQQELREIQERFTLFMQHMPGPACIKDLEGRHQFVNEAFAAMADCPRESLIGRTDLELWPEHADVQVANDRWVAEHNRTLHTVEMRHQSNGNARSYLVNRFPIRGNDGRPVSIGAVGVDFTERLLAERRLARLSSIHEFASGINAATIRSAGRQELLQETCRLAVEQGGFALAWVGILDENERTLAAFEHAQASRRPAEALAVPDRASAAAVVARVVQVDASMLVDGSAEGERQVSEATLAGKAPAGLPLRLDGRTIGALVLHASEAHAIDDEEMKLLAQLAGDISFGLEYLSKKERLDYFSFYDTLTGLPNRTLYADRINQTLQAHSSARGKLAVVLLDIERFSFINESLGRQAGDELLKRVGSALDETLGPMGGVARVGADTFAIGIVEVREDADIARILEEQIAGALGRPFSVEHQDLRIAFKCGVAMHPGDGDDAESLLRNAETALKNAKSKGERYLFYATAMNAHVADVLALENQLRIAIVEDQFVLHYQPKVNVRTRRVYGVEALIRWQQPGGMLVPPSSFVPILEDTGMIVDVGMWVLRQAARDQRHWLLTHGCAPRISVNVSSLQLRQKRFVEDAVEAIRSEGGDASMIDLEITETVIMENIAQYIPKLKALRAHGMGIEIDDFGTGYASLAYLGKLPVTALKIDRSFVTAMTTTVEDQTITSTIISLANLLKLSVVAEGVETEEQREMLQALDCENMQGYLFSRPVPAAEIERLYLGRRSPADCSPSAAGACQPPLKNRASCNGR